MDADANDDKNANEVDAELIFAKVYPEACQSLRHATGFFDFCSEELSLDKIAKDKVDSLVYSGNFQRRGRIKQVAKEMLNLHSKYGWKLKQIVIHESSSGLDKLHLLATNLEVDMYTYSIKNGKAVLIEYDSNFKFTAKSFPDFDIRNQ